VSDFSDRIQIPNIIFCFRHEGLNESPGWQEYQVISCSWNSIHDAPKANLFFRDVKLIAYLTQKVYWYFRQTYCLFHRVEENPSKQKSYWFSLGFLFRPLSEQGLFPVSCCYLA
jgi:hypothetical protein